MANPTFTLGANVLVFSKGLNYPVRAPQTRVQAVDRTAGGSLQVESLGGGIARLFLDFSNLTPADIAAAEHWFESVANGAANAFTYTDMDDTVFTVRWMNGLDFVERPGGFDGSIELEVVG